MNVSHRLACTVECHRYKIITFYLVIIVFHTAFPWIRIRKAQRLNSGRGNLAISSLPIWGMKLTFSWYEVIFWYCKMVQGQHLNKCLAAIMLKRFPPPSTSLVSDPDMHHDTCVTHVPWCMSGSLTRGGREDVPGITDAWSTSDFTYPARGP